MRSNKKGAILIASLWILSILSILAIGIGFRVSIEARLSKYNMDRLKALYLAKAGFYKAQAILLKNTNSYDTIWGCGITMNPDKRLEDVFTESLSDGKFAVSYEGEGKTYYGMSDEDRKININANAADINTLKELLAGNENSEEIAASIIAWRGTAQLLKGAWDNYYESLPAPYKCKHAPFSCVEELMLVKGVTPELFESIKDYITVYGDAAKLNININTASRRVMLACGLSGSAVESIIAYRNGIDNEAGTKDDLGFSVMPAQAGFQYLTNNDIAILGKSFTTKSNYFRIESKGIPDRSKITSKIACIVNKGARKLEYYREY